MAVHLDEEKATIPDSKSASSSSSKSGIKHTDSWLERTRKKQRRTHIIGWVIALGFLAVVAAVVLVFLWFAKVGPFDQ
ncbi:hypothetical protein HRR83_008570 [Exophiala dermatitidis]|nr:hypothetical protein HRR73_008385 [Exophiala dermatitidis]KAJ4506065.1 hypothetical protein HRR74_008495 [Exophiala dermatitidis]KAJ4563646.1 hypothetical protein HRR81_008481 [Exophiala dermatitidis]KAJ4588278.1 hypothetical protein HRR83_008570 [Exophiala dermatitidis]KAJ4604060.1 hypothetical protein HRR84_001138 [Exophiala dermatitidis]